MTARHGDIEGIADLHDVPGRTERDEPTVAAGVSAEHLLSCACQRSDLERFEVYDTDGVILGVGYVQARPVEGGALRVVEHRVRGSAVLQAAFAGAYHGLDAALRIRPDDAVVA